MHFRDRSSPYEAGIFRVCVAILASVFWIGTSQADPQLDGQGDLGRRNLTEKTLEIGGDVYHFTEASVILDRDGKPIALEALDVQDEEGEARLRPVQTARFSAVEVADRYVIQRLELVETPH